MAKANFQSIELIFKTYDLISHYLISKVVEINIFFLNYLISSMIRNNF